MTSIVAERDAELSDAADEERLAAPEHDGAVLRPCVADVDPHAIEVADVTERARLGDVDLGGRQRRLGVRIFAAGDERGRGILIGSVAKRGDGGTRASRRETELELAHDAGREIADEGVRYLPVDASAGHHEVATEYAERDLRARLDAAREAARLAAGPHEHVDRSGRRHLGGAAPVDALRRVRDVDDDRARLGGELAQLLPDVAQVERRDGGLRVLEVAVAIDDRVRLALRDRARPRRIHDERAVLEARRRLAGRAEGDCRRQRARSRHWTA